MLDKIHNLPTIIDIILIPDFSLMAFSSAIEPLRLANRLADRKLYDWRVSPLDIGNQSWSVTIPIKGQTHNYYWRRLKQE